MCSFYIMTSFCNTNILCHNYQSAVNRIIIVMFTPVDVVVGAFPCSNRKLLSDLIAIIIHSKYFPDSDWLKAHE